jgi:FtsH-binding integral membrane protein
MNLMTVVWGLGLIAQTALACVLVFTLSIRNYLIVSPILGYGAMGALALWTFWYGKRARRIGDARRAAELTSR